jgi:hypothetical protein
VSGIDHNSRVRPLNRNYALPYQPPIPTCRQALSGRPRAFYSGTGFLPWYCNCGGVNGCSVFCLARLGTVFATRSTTYLYGITVRAYLSAVTVTIGN